MDSKSVASNVAYATATGYLTVGGSNPGAFDWGLPFFFGRNVFTAIEDQVTPAGKGPFVAF